MDEKMVSLRINDIPLRGLQHPVAVFPEGHQ